MSHPNRWGAPSHGREFHWRTEKTHVAWWLEQIRNAQARQSNFFRMATVAWEAYRNEDRTMSGITGIHISSTTGRQFTDSHPMNIYHSNIEAIKNHVFSQEPLPRVRRRRGRSSPAERVAADLMQKALASLLDAPYSISTNKLLARVRNDYLIAGRGMCAVEYKIYGTPRRVDPQPVRRADATQPWVLPTGEIVPDGEVRMAPPEDPRAPDADKAKTDSEGRLLEGVWNPGLASSVDGGGVFEGVELKYVSPLDVLFQPARRWEEVQWAAQVMFPTWDELAESWGVEVADRATYTSWTMHNAMSEATQAPAAKETDTGTTGGGRPPDARKRAKLWKVYDRRNARVIWLTETPPGAMAAAGVPSEQELGGVILHVDPGERHLHSFFPFPEPIQTGSSNETLDPVPEFVHYEALFRQIQAMVIRWQNIVESIRVLGIVNARDFAAVNTALADESGAARVASLSEHGGAPNAATTVTWMPIGEILQAAQAYYDTLMKLVNLTWQISGVSDILRGASSPRETATAQRNKVQFGLGPLGDKKRAFAEFCKELLNMMVELICGRMELDSILSLAGVRLRTEREIAEEAQMLQMEGQRIQMERAQQQETLSAAQASQAAERTSVGPPPGPDPGVEIERRLRELQREASREAVERILRNDFLRYFAIEVETDSTIVVDQQAEAANRNEMLQALNQFNASFPPLVQMGVLPREFLRQMVISLVSGTPGSRELTSVLEGHEPPPPAPPPPTPEQVKAETEKLLAQMAHNHDAAESDKQRSHDARIKYIDYLVDVMKADAGQLDTWLDIAMRVYEKEATREGEREKIVSDLKKAAMQLEAAQAKAKQAAQSAKAGGGE